MKDLQQAIQFSKDHESLWDRNVNGAWGVHVNDPPPWNRLLGPVHDRGPVSGAISVDGQVLTTWGEPDRADLTFSIAKTYLALLAGVAFELVERVKAGAAVEDVTGFATALLMGGIAALPKR